jgi:hypothetical protein
VSVARFGVCSVSVHTTAMGPTDSVSATARLAKRCGSGRGCAHSEPRERARSGSSIQKKRPGVPSVGNHRRRHAVAGRASARRLRCTTIRQWASATATRWTNCSRVTTSCGSSRRTCTSDAPPVGRCGRVSSSSLSSRSDTAAWRLLPTLLTLLAVGLTGQSASPRAVCRAVSIY